MAACGRSGACRNDRRPSRLRPRRLGTEAALNGPVRRTGLQIIGQQISATAATAIFARLTARFGGRVPDAGELAAVDQEALRGLGLSRRKAATVLDLGQRFSDGRLSETMLREQVKGIGAWTVHGALLIARHRPDVIRTDDPALRHSIQARYGLDHLPDPAEDGRPRPPLEAVQEPRIQPAAGRREIERFSKTVTAGEISHFQAYDARRSS